MATNEEILREIEADWQDLKDKVLKIFQEKKTDKSGVIPIPVDDYPWTENELYGRNPDYREINEFVDHLHSRPLKQELEDLVVSLTSPLHDPEIYLDVLSYPFFLEHCRRIKVAKLNQLKSKLAPLKNYEAPDDLLNSLTNYVNLAKGGSAGAVRRIDLYLEFLEKQKPRVSPLEAGKKQTKFRKKVFSDELWGYLFEKTYSFLKKYVSKDTKPYVVCRLSVTFLSILYPKIFQFYEVDLDRMTNTFYKKISKPKTSI